MAYVYVVARLLTLSVLWHRRYQRLFPLFASAFAANTAVAVLTAFLPATSRLNRYLWAPGEMLAIMLTTAAVVEAIWTSVRQLPPRQAAIRFAGILGGAAGLTVEMWRGAAGDWYWQFIAARSYIYAGLGIAAFAGLWFGLWGNRYWPRVARMHAGLITMAVSAHALFGSMSAWRANNLDFRLLEMACGAGWLINSGFLARERRELVTAQTSVAARAPVPGLVPSRLLRAGQIAAQGD